MKTDLGTKRVCGVCGAKFYDMMKRPILCPKCGATYKLETAVSRKVASRAVAEEAEEKLDDTLVSLEEAETEGAATGKVSTVNADEDADEPLADGDEDDTFLVQEEEDTDVSELIDGEIEDEDQER